MTLKELQEKRSKLLSDAQALSQKGFATAEDRSAFDAMMADVEAVEGDIARCEKIESRAVSVPRPNPGESVDADNRTPEQRKKDVNAALRNYLKTGMVETRDLTIAGDGILIPTAVAEPRVAKKYAGAVYDLVNKLTTATGEPVKVPFVNDTSNGFVLNSTAISTTDPTVNGITISVDDIRMNPILIDNSLLQDAGFDLAAFVSEAAQERYLRTVNSYITSGNTSAVGALTAISTGITTATTATLAYVDFVSAVAALDPAYALNAVWTMSNSTLGTVLGLKDTNGRPLFLNFDDGVNSGFVGKILGYPVRINPYLPNVATGNVAVQFGDMKAGYTFREVSPGIVLKRLNERYAELNKTGFVAFARVGGAVTDAGTHPILSVTIK